jgi:hypothetical protein
MDSLDQNAIKLMKQIDCNSLRIINYVDGFVLSGLLAIEQIVILTCDSHL